VGVKFTASTGQVNSREGRCSSVSLDSQERNFVDEILNISGTKDDVRIIIQTIYPAPLHCRVKVKVKVRQFRYRPGVAQRVPGS
jgi:hypothetical protein